MLLLVKIMLVSVVLVMFFMLLSTPIKAGQPVREIILDAGRLGRGIEFQIWQALKRLPAGAQLTIVDDGSDKQRSKMLVRILSQNPGIKLKICSPVPGTEPTIGLKAEYQGDL